MPDLNRDTLEGLRKSFAELATGSQEGEDGPIGKARGMLDELMKSVDQLVKEFEKIALGEWFAGPTAG